MMRKRLSVTLLAIFGVFMLISACQPGKGAYTPGKGDIKFLNNPHWNQGKAEYQKYNYKLGWYGAQRETMDSLMVLVKEPWDTNRHVKVPWKKANTYVLKLSLFDVFQTGTYSYSFKSDIYMDVTNGKVLKYVMGSHDGCGNHFMKYEKRGNVGRFTWHSYWNGHGLISRNLSADSYDTFYDALPAYLRFRLDKESYTVKAIQPLVANRPLDINAPGKHYKDQQDAMKRGLPAILNLSVTNTKGQEMTDAKGVKHKAIKTTVKSGSKVTEFYFAEAFPHTLIKMKGKAEKTLRVSKFFPYWVPANRGKPAGFFEK